HLPGEAANIMATEQALMALAGYALLTEGMPGVYEGLGAVRATVYIEGPSAALSSGTVKALTALQAIEELLKQQSIDYEKEVFSFGTIVSSVKGIEGGIYGGYDGWLFAVER